MHYVTPPVCHACCMSRLFQCHSLFLPPAHLSSPRCPFLSLSGSPSLPPSPFLSLYWPVWPWHKDPLGLPRSLSAVCVLLCAHMMTDFGGFSRMGWRHCRWRGNAWRCNALPLARCGTLPYHSCAAPCALFSFTAGARGCMFRADNGWTAATCAQKARHNAIYVYLCKVASGRIDVARMQRAHCSKILHRNLVCQLLLLGQLFLLDAASSARRRGVLARRRCATLAYN